jgi:energy-converting hydrogenase B subunit D
MTPWFFDLMLVIGVVLLAWRVIVTPSLFRSVVLFITLGLLLALSWVRLDAPDVALAEAAIGAGLTGALLLDAVGQMESGRQASAEEDHDHDHDQRGPNHRRS